MVGKTHRSIRRQKPGTLSLAALICVAVLTAAGCSGGTTIASSPLSQDLPVLADHPDPDFAPNTTGAVLFFAANMRNGAGELVGELFGQLTTLDVTLNGIDEEDRLRELVFDLDDGQIIVLGASHYAATEAPDFGNDNAPVSAVIVGGTGVYVGVRGTVVTEKLDNGTYTHTFDFVD
jgi:hypothetical protein